MSLERIKVVAFDYDNTLSPPQFRNNIETLVRDLIIEPTVSLALITNNNAVQYCFNYYGCIENRWFPLNFMFSVEQDMWFNSDRMHKLFGNEDVHVLKTLALHWIAHSRKLKPSEILFVDDLIENISLARRCGFETQLIKTSDDFQKIHKRVFEALYY